MFDLNSSTHVLLQSPLSLQLCVERVVISRTNVCGVCGVWRVWRVWCVACVWCVWNEYPTGHYPSVTMCVALLSNRTLVTLEMGTNELTDATAEKLGLALKVNNKLEGLSLWQNDITAEVNL